MKFRKLITGIAAGVFAAASLTFSASAYDLNTDLNIFWSASKTVPGTEFIGVRDGAYITVTYSVDQSLADMDGHNYWCIKPMINDSGWPLVDGIAELTPSEDGSSYVIEPDTTSITFTIPEAHAEHVEIAGLAFMGHGITLETLTVSDEAPVVDTPVEEPVVDITAPVEGGNPNTGVEGAAAAVGAAFAAAGMLYASRKK
ncbi:MAG: hypothetical protein E7478_00980 [Ruminococcaceae bacterium]|nr:hypothetical protein [Oscillospiraceae bacterium]